MLPSLLYDPLCACSNGISRKDQRMRACGVRAVLKVCANMQECTCIARESIPQARAGCAGGVGKRA
jgi:hypothetical protein